MTGGGEQANGDRGAASPNGEPATGEHKPATAELQLATDGLRPASADLRATSDDQAAQRAPVATPATTATLSANGVTTAAAPPLPASLGARPIAAATKVAPAGKPPARPVAEDLQSLQHDGEIAPIARRETEERRSRVRAPLPAGGEASPVAARE